jgi:penicillin-binding protein 2
LARRRAIPGNNLVTTIDYRIQKAAEKAMDEHLVFLQTKLGNPNAKAAAAVVMNPKTGEILAMVSRPAFNPNLFNGGISAKDWKVLNDNPFHPMDNRAIAGEYAPGSTFKIITGTAALDIGQGYAGGENPRHRQTLALSQEQTPWARLLAGSISQEALSKSR